MVNDKKVNLAVLVVVLVLGIQAVCSEDEAAASYPTQVDAAGTRT